MLLVFCNLLFGQNKICLDYPKETGKTELVFNGVKYSYESIYGINSDEISEIRREIDKGKEYIIINTNKEYFPDFVALEDIAKEKKIKNYLVLVDDRVITGVYRIVYIDKKVILDIKDSEIVFNKKALKVLSIKTTSGAKTEINDIK
jgi:hypothetical protein